MLSGFYTIASGLLTRQKEQDVIGNNLINAQTPGYRADRLMIAPFEMQLLNRIEQGAANQLDNPRAAVAAITDEVASINREGTLKPTERSMDMAILGDGYFNVQGPGGQVYLTRNGGFDIDGEGYLTLPNVGRVLGESGPLNVRNANFSLSANGELLSDEGNRIGTLLVTAPPDNTVLEKLDNGMFRFVGGGGAQRVQNPSIVQNTLELSNVDLNQELTLLMESQRAFQTCSSALQIVDTMNKKTTQIASV